MGKNSAFIDSSVIISALLSAKGGSFHILDRMHVDFTFQINHYVFDEVQRVLREKFKEQSDSSRRFFLLLGTGKVEVLTDPSKEETAIA